MQLKACRREATLVVATAQFFANKPTLPKERPRGRTVLRKALLARGRGLCRLFAEQQGSGASLPIQPRATFTLGSSYARESSSAGHQQHRAEQFRRS